MRRKSPKKWVKQMKSKDSLKTKDIRDMTATELDQKIAGLKDELFRLRFQLATGQLENPMRIKEVKKNIARIKTIQRERELKAQA